jgi:hypothetical protein
MVSSGIELESSRFMTNEAFFLSDIQPDWLRFAIRVFTQENQIDCAYSCLHA